MCVCVCQLPELLCRDLLEFSIFAFVVAYSRCVRTAGCILQAEGAAKARGAKAVSSYHCCNCDRGRGGTVVCACAVHGHLQAVPRTHAGSTGVYSNLTQLSISPLCMPHRSTSFTRSQCLPQQAVCVCVNRMRHSIFSVSTGGAAAYWTTCCASP